jgi:GxxExxY protein
VGIRESHFDEKSGDHSLTGRIIEAIIRVHQVLGPGFLESIYRNALCLEFAARGLRFDDEQEVVIYYEGHVVGRHRLDLIVEDEVILELKTVDDLSKSHYAQLRSYLKATGKRTGLLVNFASEKADFRRVDLPQNPNIHPPDPQHTPISLN